MATLPTSGPLSLSQIGLNFNDVQPYSMSEEYEIVFGTPTGPISISQFYGKGTTLTTTVSPTTITKTNFTYGSTTQWTSVSYVYSEGGRRPYSYEWQYVSGDTEIVIESTGGSPNLNTTKCSNRWRISGGSVGITYQSVWRCLVTDENSDTILSQNITVTCSYS